MPSRSTHRKLVENMVAYRIGDPKGAYPVYSAAGARLVQGRWHAAGQEVIYCSRSYSTALLERLVNSSGRLPKRQCYLEITIPRGTTYEVVTVHSLGGWDARSGKASRAFGAKWIAQCRSAILIVPSVVARMEHNVLINPGHPDAARITVGLEMPVAWDTRLFS